jgi:Cdc6-like AAA superfamily ATPase
VTKILRPTVIDDSQLKLISQYSRGDAKLGVLILQKAAVKAEAKRLTEIQQQLIDETVMEIQCCQTHQTMPVLNDHQRILMHILEQRRMMMSGQLYREYVANVAKPVGDRAYRKYMQQLKRLGIVKAIGKGRWKMYKC